jgi:hypothetical protein
MHFLTSALGGGEWSALCPGHFAPRERAPGTHCVGGWVGPRACSGCSGGNEPLGSMKGGEFLD